MTIKPKTPTDGMMLYRGETPEAIGFDIHGGYGETWTIDLEHAWGYARGPQGQLRQALLPATVKRLVLVDPVTNNYNWSHLKILARLINNPFLTQTLKTGWQIYDLWQPNWTLRLKQVGYDSIATVSIEGSEEYVLSPSKLILLSIVSAGDVGVYNPKGER